MKKYIITEEQLKMIVEYNRLNESTITTKDGKLKINDHLYSVSVEGKGDVDIENVVPNKMGGYDITASKFFVTKTVPVTKERVDSILKQVPKETIVSPGKTTFTLSKV